MENSLESPKDRIIYKFFEILPAFLSWGTLFLAFILSWQAPAAAAVFIIIFAFFWLFRVIYLSLHQLAGYKLMKKNLSIDWLEKIKNHDSSSGRWQDVRHLIILPMYKENISVLRSSFSSLLDSNYPKDKMMVVLTVEERGGEEAEKTARKAENEFSKFFLKFLVTCHPKNIVGEIAGKGSNVNWAVKKAKELIDNEISLPYENIIVSNFDIDTKPYPQYFAVLTWHYLNSKNPLRTSFQPIPVYNNNVWQAPAFSRVIATSGTFWQMMQQERPEQLVTYSSHAMAFKTIIDVGYPKDIVSDDSRIFWKSYFTYDGDYRVVPLYYPVSMDAVMSENLLRTAVNQYKQQRRWAWGCENIPYVFYSFLKNKKIPLKEKIYQSFVMLDGFWSWAVAALLIFFLGWLPLRIGSPDFQTSMLSYNLPYLTSYIMTAAMAGMIVSAVISLLILPPRPEKHGKLKSFSMLLQWFLLPVTLIFFGSFPSLESQMRLALGKDLGFWVTEKTRK